MKKLLVVAYYFPPSGGPGVQRVLNYVKYLPEFGWLPIVLTVAEGDFPARDESLLQEIPAPVPVIRTKIIEPYRLYRRVRGLPQGAPVDVNVLHDRKNSSWKERVIEFIRSTFFIPDARIGWYPFALRAAKKIFQQHTIHALYSSSPPYTTSVIALSLKRRYQIPWIAGFRDPWSGFLTTPKRWWLPATIERILERQVVSSADLLECAWRGIVKDFQKKFPEVPEDKYIVIPNGFNPEHTFPIPYRKNPQFTLTYTGSLYGKRNPQPLIDAITQLIVAQKIDRNQLLLQIIGRVGEDIRQQLSSANFSVKIVPYVPFAESIHYIQHSELLILLVDESPHACDIVPGKLFEYIAVKRPILAIGPQQSEVGEILNITGTGKIFPPTNISLIADYIYEIYQRWQNGTMERLIAQMNDAEIQKYNRRLLTKKLASLLSTLSP